MRRGVFWTATLLGAAAANGHCDPDGYPRAPEGGDPTPECLSEANDHDFETWTKTFAERASM